MLKDLIELQPGPWFLAEVVSTADHGAGQVATECQEERAMNVFGKQIHRPAGGYGPSLARDLLQSRQSIYYLYIYYYKLERKKEVSVPDGQEGQ